MRALSWLLAFAAWAVVGAAVANDLTLLGVGTLEPPAGGGECSKILLEVADAVLLEDGTYLCLET